MSEQPNPREEHQKWCTRCKRFTGHTLRDHLDAEQEQGEWQPIETAPKDQAVLVYHLAYLVAHLSTAENRWIGYGRDAPSAATLNLFPPTHWMPLPEPPSEEQGNG